MSGWHKFHQLPSTICTVFTPLATVLWNTWMPHSSDHSHYWLALWRLWLIVLQNILSYFISSLIIRLDTDGLKSPFASSFCVCQFSMWHFHMARWMQACEVEREQTHTEQNLQADALLWLHDSQSDHLSSTNTKQEHRSEFFFCLLLHIWL